MNTNTTYKAPRVHFTSSSDGGTLEGVFEEKKINAK